MTSRKTDSSTETAPLMDEIRDSLAEINSSLAEISRSTVLRNQFELFRSIRSVNDDDISAMKAVMEEHIDVRDFNITESLLNRKSLRRVATMERTYEYLVFAFGQTRAQADPEHSHFYTGRLELWIEDLGRYREFQFVHLRQGRYYPEFAPIVNRILYTAGLRDRRLAEADLKKAKRRKKDPEREERIKKALEDATSMALSATKQAADELFLRYHRRVETNISSDEKSRLLDYFKIGTALTLTDRTEFIQAVSTEDTLENPFWDLYFSRTDTKDKESTNGC